MREQANEAVKVSLRKIHFPKTRVAHGSAHNYRYGVGLSGGGLYVMPRAVASRGSARSSAECTLSRLVIFTEEPCVLIESIEDLRWMFRTAYGPQKYEIYPNENAVGRKSRRRRTLPTYGTSGRRSGHKSRRKNTGGGRRRSAGSRRKNGDVELLSGEKCPRLQFGSAPFRWQWTPDLPDGTDIVDRFHQRAILFGFELGNGFSITNKLGENVGSLYKICPSQDGDTSTSGGDAAAEGSATKVACGYHLIFARAPPERKPARSAAETLAAEAREVARRLLDAAASGDAAAQGCAPQALMRSAELAAAAEEAARPRRKPLAATARTRISRGYCRVVKLMYVDSLLPAPWNINYAMRRRDEFEVLMTTQMPMMDCTSEQTVDAWLMKANEMFGNLGPSACQALWYISARCPKADLKAYFDLPQGDTTPIEEVVDRAIRKRYATSTWRSESTREMWSDSSAKTEMEGYDVHSEGIPPGAPYRCGACAVSPVDVIEAASRKDNLLGHPENQGRPASEE
ncbi:hypothetical protein GNI_047260 [Gregarina niphandrodes]|uniref:Uncharacterized protein n=1 Tax=Gregarina niphandrodes TaxID=110365 RepID=A0A023B9P7_GRENI|nr:hypothetical protein GNI_047260 [Gregarina niphandrodes]EZG74590.1 hypothetical protein GNI_047260 [Gregarina niphandrodes]|eukprot:XP_011129624.1 hypothetical protein GNI_047260 [Gregarina niphandrodes]